jgi:DNA-binding response OmpR family regulator
MEKSEVKKEAKKTVLIIDDDNDLRTVLKDKLDVSGFDTISAADGEEGLKKALGTHPDVILLDVMMPKMNGRQVLAKLREDAWGKTARVIMLTVLEDMDTVADATDKGTFGYLVKTNQSLDGVVEHVREALKRRMMEDTGGEAIVQTHTDDPEFF